ncbi:MAG: InlB B-repeat-containing protein, partial [Acidimicrobiales bacterium]
TSDSSAFEEVPSADCSVTTDERGDPRPGVPGENCDAGAFEYQQPPSDTVTFNSDGGAAVTSISGPDGSSITLPSDTYPGYGFDGWFTAASGGTEVGGAGSSYTIPSGGITLYAQWTKQVSQTISFAKLANKTMAHSPVTVHATASSGLTVTFTTTTHSVCTSGGANGATITLLEAGTCTVEASQAGNDFYRAATPVSRSFTVSQVSQTISFATLPTSDRQVRRSHASVKSRCRPGVRGSVGRTEPGAGGAR